METERLPDIDNKNISKKSKAKDTKKAEAPAEGEATESIASKGDIVYVDLDRILMDYDMANDLRSVVETKVQNIQAEVTRRGKKLENDVKSFQEKMNKGLMTRSVAEVQQQKLMQQEQEFNEYAAKKQGEIQEEQVVMMNQLGDAIKTFLDNYNAEKQYKKTNRRQGRDKKNNRQNKIGTNKLLDRTLCIHCNRSLLRAIRLFTHPVTVKSAGVHSFCHYTTHLQGFQYFAIIFSASQNR